MEKRRYIKNICCNSDNTLHCNSFYWNRDGVECPCMHPELDKYEDGTIFEINKNNLEIIKDLKL